MTQPVEGLAYDSRKVRQGDVFFAVPGAYSDGHDFVDQAVEQGAVAVVVERRVSVPPEVTVVFPLVPVTPTKTMRRLGWA